MLESEETNPCQNKNGSGSFLDVLDLVLDCTEFTTTSSPHPTLHLSVECASNAMTNDETVVLRASAPSRACSPPRPVTTTGVGRFERSPITAASRRRRSLRVAAVPSCAQPLHGSRFRSISTPL